jgi:hypothetical protein
MFVGHLALAFASKPAAPKLSLGWLVAAVTTADLVWPIFLLAGVERATIEPGATAFTPLRFDYYPWSHSLVMLAAWGAALAVLARWRGVRSRDAVLLFGLVMSHWVLDVITHAPDMSLWPGDSPRLGFVLWNSIPGTLVIEGALWVAAIVIYLRGRGSTKSIGTATFWSFVAVSTVIWISGPWSPPPDSVQALGWFGLVGWIVIPWAAFADRYFVTSP